MRLIHTTEHYIKTFNFDVPPYAILSHRWAKNDAEEVSHQDFRNGEKRDSLGYRKILRFCEIAVANNVQWAWVDTACIDKSSSAELSESINSMFRYYEQAVFCCIFLLPSDCEILRTEHFEQIPTWTSSTGFVHHDVQVPGITADSWFSRGWTLQELLAPEDARFFAVGDDFFSNPEFLGDKRQWSTALETITGIPRVHLTGFDDFRKATVAQRMSWASKRITSRVEDIAYCLLGIFDINMPLLYGEGEKAFRRLQETILLQVDDESIFAWATTNTCHSSGILASSPVDFGRYRCLELAPGTSDRPPCSFSSKGIQLHVAIDSWSNLMTPTLSGIHFPSTELTLFSHKREVVVPLQCRCRCGCSTISRRKWHRSRNMAIVLQRERQGSELFARGPWVRTGPQELLEVEHGPISRFLRIYCRYAPILCHPGSLRSLRSSTFRLSERGSLSRFIAIYVVAVNVLFGYLATSPHISGQALSVIVAAFLCHVYLISRGDMTTVFLWILSIAIYYTIPQATYFLYSLVSCNVIGWFCVSLYRGAIWGI